MILAVGAMPRFERAKSPMIELGENSRAVVVDGVGESGGFRHELRIRNGRHVRRDAPALLSNGHRALTDQPRAGGRRGFESVDESVDCTRSVAGTFEQRRTVQPISNSKSTDLDRGFEAGHGVRSIRSRLSDRVPFY